MTRSISSCVKEKTPEEKTRESSINKSIEESSSQETPSHKNSNLGKYLEQKRTSSIPKQTYIIEKIHKELTENIIKNNSQIETKMNKNISLSRSRSKDIFKSHNESESDFVQSSKKLVKFSNLFSQNLNL